MPLLKPEISGWIKPPLKVHMRKESGASLCGLMWTDGDATDEPNKVTCERCRTILKKSSGNTNALKLVLGLLAIGALAMSGCSKPKNENLLVWDRPDLLPRNLPITQSTTCRFKQSLAASFRKVITSAEPSPPERVYDSYGPENESDTVAFLDLDTKAPKVQSNGGEQSFLVASDEGENLTLIQNRRGGVEVYMIFRKKGVVVHTQTEDAALIGPSGLVEMGYCN